MREIKFRMWLNKTKEMKQVSIQPLPQWSIETVGHLMQYTGLKDKNGKEVFEGDIAMYPKVHEDDQYLGKVVYDNDLAAYTVEQSNGGWNYLYEFIVENKTVHFDKNIYENPELLK